MYVGMLVQATQSTGACTWSPQTGMWMTGNSLEVLRQLLPPRPGCHIERHRCKTEGQQTWQVRFGKILGYVRVGGYVYTLFSHFLNTALRTSSPPHWRRRKRSGNYTPLCQNGGKAWGEAGIVPPIFRMSVDIAKVWYPRLDPDDETEPRSHTVTGPDALNAVMSWAWNKHAKWLAN